MLLLDAAEEAGIVPLGILRLHAYAYLSNVLAPVWDMPALDGKILKRLGGPFYPALQEDLDRLVGLGMVVISDLKHVRDQGHWRLDGRYRLNRQFASDVLDLLYSFPDEHRTIGFVQELGFALSTLSDEDFGEAVGQDATYSDPIVGFGDVIDFDEWRHRNSSVNAARYFDQVLPGGNVATAGEKLHLYARHLYRRAHAKG